MACIDLRKNNVDLRNTMAGWSFSDLELSTALSGSVMLNPSLDLSNPCNLNCPYCFIEEKNSARKVRKPHELSLTELSATIEEFAIAGAKTVNLVGAGEPTIDPEFQNIVSLISSLSMVTVVFTNGIRLAHDLALVDFLYSHRATVVLKFNAFNENVQDLVAGRPGYTKKRNQALENLQDAGFHAHMPTRLGLDIIAFKGNLHEIPDIHKLCRSNGILPIVGDYIPTGRTEFGSFAGFESVRILGDDNRVRVSELLKPLSPLERAELYSTLATTDRVVFGIGRAEAAAYYGGGTCTQILGLYVDILGNIWPCVARAQRSEGHLLSLPLGNIREGASVIDVWRTHPYMNRLRLSYDGGCPYKTPLTVPNLVAASTIVGFDD